LGRSGAGTENVNAARWHEGCNSSAPADLIESPQTCSISIGIAIVEFDPNGTAIRDRIEGLVSEPPTSSHRRAHPHQSQRGEPFFKMCGRVIQSSSPLRLAIVDGVEVRDSRMGNVRPRYNAAPSQELLVIRENHKTGERSLDLINGD
jgi:hypothetical protein